MHSSNVSSNRIKIQVILLILQLETDYFSSYSFQKSSIRSSGTTVFTETSELLFYMKKSYRILQLQFQLQFYTCTLHYNPENSPSRIQFYMQKTESSSSTATTFQKRNSTHRRQGDLLEIHPCVLQDIPGIQPQDLPKASRHSGHSSHS